MTRRYGRCAKGRRLIAKAPWGHWKTITFVPSLRDSGIIAPLVLDNLPAHKVAGVKGAIAGHGASLMDLPPDSPDLNPIEQLLAKLKALLRKAAARTPDGLWSTIGEALDAFTPDECRNYIRNSGNEPVSKQIALRGFVAWLDRARVRSHSAFSLRRMYEHRAAQIPARE